METLHLQPPLADARVGWTRRGSTRFRWGICGTVFGFTFPLVAIALRFVERGEAGAWESLSSDPLLWIILTAPIFLGLFAFLGGRQHGAVLELTRTLEQRVVARTSELRLAVDRLSLILDTTGNGLVVLSLSGHIEEEPSASAKEWLGPPGDGADVGKWIFGEDTRQINMFAMGLRQLADAFLPDDLLLSQMPRSLRRGNRLLELEYRRIKRDRRSDQLLMIIEDATARHAAIEADAAREEHQQIIVRLLKNPRAFESSRVEIGSMVDTVCGVATAEVRARTLHTIKGSAGVMGFSFLARIVHELEERAAGAWTDADAAMLRGSWKRAMALLTPYEATLDVNQLEVTREDITRLCTRIAGGATPGEVSDTLRRWQLSPATTIVRRLGDQARRIADQLGRRITVTQSVGDVRIDGERTRELWASLIHVIRNAVDHGLSEPPEVRLAAGKPAEGQLKLVMEQQDDRVWLRIADDGRGIDWEGVRKSAAARGLAHDTRAALIDALFDDGLSTREEITLVSGRGIGLAAVRGISAKLGVIIDVKSAKGCGTELSFELPKSLTGEESRASGAPSPAVRLACR